VAEAAQRHREFLDPAVLGRLSRLTVVPRGPVSGTVSGLHKSVLRGASVEFAEYRKYVPGDEIRYLDWRVYARTDRFYLKEFEAETNLRAHLVLDTSGSMGFSAAHGTRLDYARRLAATLAYVLVRQGDAVGLTTFAERRHHDLAPRHTPSHLRNIFDALAEVRAAGESRIVEQIHDLAERIRGRSLVILFSDLFADPEPLVDCLQHLRFRKHDVVVFHLLDRQEVDFAFDRPIRFVDLETPYTQTTDPVIVREGYTRALARHLEVLQRGCREFRVDYQRVVTDADYEKVLAAFMLQRMNRTPGAGARR
jgi:uncharacterized protein (DUF58 family)